MTSENSGAGDSPAQDDPAEFASDSSLGQGLTAVATSRMALAADFLGALGIYGVVSWFVDKFHQKLGHDILGWPDAAWTTIIGSLFVVAFGFLFSGLL